MNFRTDNAIKNHFYSKLRKFIRKMLKQLNKENLLKNNSVDINKYNSDHVYKIIKKNKLPYNSLNKESILALIVNHDRNFKNVKLESQFLKTKTNRKKIIKNVKNERDPIKVGENMYDEKVVKRRNKNEINCEGSDELIAPKRGSFRDVTRISNQHAFSRKIGENKLGVASRKKSTVNICNIPVLNQNKVLLCKIIILEFNI